ERGQQPEGCEDAAQRGLPRHLQCAWRDGRMAQAGPPARIRKRGVSVGGSALARLPAGRRVQLGLRANWQQFALLVAVNAFVGGMVGMERSVLPILARDEFGIASNTVAVSFIATFGLAKA